MFDFLTEEQLALLTGWAIRGGIALAIFIAGWLVSKWTSALALRAFRKGKMDEALARFFAAMIQYAVIAFAVIAALDKAGVETTSLAAVLAAAGLAVGLALQGSLSNFASGVLLLVFRPFTIGDRVSTAGHSGKVADIGLFATTLSTPANERIIIPNASVTGDSIINHTSAGRIRASIGVGVAYGADIDHVLEVLRDAASSAEHVLDDPGPVVGFADMAASSLNFVVHCWAESDKGVLMQHNARKAIYEKLGEAGIEIPFDQLVIHKAS